MRGIEKPPLHRQTITGPLHRLRLAPRRFARRIQMGHRLGWPGQGAGVDLRSLGIGTIDIRDFAVRTQREALFEASIGHRSRQGRVMRFLARDRVEASQRHFTGLRP